MSSDREERSTGMSKAVWLLMLREGGRWRPSEIEEALSATRRGGVPAVGAILAAMTSGGQVRRFQAEGAKWGSYGITAGCKLPMGLTVAELGALGMLRLEPEAQA